MKEIYLIGRETDRILGAKLPSNRQVLSVFFFNTRSKKLKNNESAKLVTQLIMDFWKNARIPTIQDPNCVLKVLKLHKEWENLQRSSKKNSEHQKNKEKVFCEKLDDLFDVAHANALDQIKIPEDKEFLLKQREKRRPGCMLGVDISLAQKEKRRSDRLQQEENRRKKTEVESVATSYSEIGMCVRWCVLCCVLYYKL